MNNLSAIDRHLADLQALRTSLGKRLTAIYHDVYYFNGEQYGEGGGSLELRFEGNDHLTLHLASDGEAVRAVRESLVVPEPFDVALNSHCEWKLVELTADTTWSRLKGARLTDVEAMLHCWKRQGETLNGWFLRFDTGDFLVYHNNGDESRILYNARPDSETEPTTRWHQLDGIQKAD